MSDPLTPSTLDETRRVSALHALQVLDTPAEPVFDALVAVASEVCGMPVSLISLVDAERQWFKANVGLPGVSETPRDVAFCAHAIGDDTVLEIDDTLLDARFAGNPLVTGEPNIRFYAGAPIVLDGGARIGTLCVIDRVPRRLEAAQRRVLQNLARAAGHCLAERQQRLAASQTLAASVQRLYEATPVMLHSIDTTGRLLAVSDTWLQVLGYERAEVIGRLSSEFLAPESQRRSREEVLPAFFRDGRCEQVEYQMLHRDGSIVDVELSAVLERDAQGVPVQSLAVLENVSARKRLAAELGRTHSHLDAIVDNVPAMLGYWDAGGVTRFANREFQAAVGLPMQQIVGTRLRELWFAVDAQGYAAMAPHVEAVLGGRREEFEFAMLTTVGLRQLRATLVPDRSDTADPLRVTGFYGLWYDITGRKTLELRLGDSELRYRSLFDNLNSGFALHEVVVDAAGSPVDYKFLAMNTAFTTMTGIDPARAMGRRVTEVLPGTAADPADWIGVFGRVALGGIPVLLEQHSEVLDRWYKVMAYRPAAGQFAVILQDITARKQAEQRIELALKEKETLLKEVYHRVKNNLQVVQSLLSLQQRSVHDPAAQAALEDSGQRVRAMALVHEKLYQSGNLAAVTLAEYIADLLRQVGEAAGAAKRGIELVADIEPLHTGLDNAIPFGLLVTELVSNGLKHAFASRSSGEVCVSLTREAAGARLSVADDGVGLPAGFDLTASASMGLQLAASLARQLGGELVASRGRGAAFSAVLTRL